MNDQKQQGVPRQGRVADVDSSDIANELVHTDARGQKARDLAASNQGQGPGLTPVARPDGYRTKFAII
jgi:hypothetical protein